MNTKNLVFYAAAVAVFAAVAWQANADYASAQGQAEAWMNPIVTREESAALEWVRANTAERTIFVTDILGGEFLMGNSLREGAEGGDWAIVPNVVSRMYDSQYKFYGASSAEEAHATARSFNAEYAWVPNRQVFAGYEWVTPNRELFGDARLFELVYEAEDASGGKMQVYKVV